MVKIGVKICTKIEKIENGVKIGLKKFQKKAKIWLKKGAKNRVEMMPK